MKTPVLLFRNEYGWHISAFKDYSVPTKFFCTLHEAKTYAEDMKYSIFRAYYHSDM